MPLVRGHEQFGERRNDRFLLIPTPFLILIVVPLMHLHGVTTARAVTKKGITSARGSMAKPINGLHAQAPKRRNHTSDVSVAKRHASLGNTNRAGAKQEHRGRQ